MTKLTKQNIGGTNYAVVGCALTGVCASSADAYTKTVTLSDGDTINDGMLIACTFTNINTAGNAPGTQTIYSSDQVSYFSDAGLTTPFTLAPSGCYTIEYTGEGNAYTYQSYPVITAGGVTAPLATADGKTASGALWQAGSIVRLLYTGGKFCVQPYNSGSVFITASSTTVNSTPIAAGSAVKIMFTSAITGSDTTTGMSISYNGTSYAVKVGKNGSLASFVASDISGTYTYLQAYTTLELAFDGTQFIIIDNPVVISNSDYTIYANGSKIVQENNTIFKPSSAAFIVADGGSATITIESNVPYMYLNTHISNVEMIIFSVYSGTVYVDRIYSQRSNDVTGFNVVSDNTVQITAPYSCRGTVWRLGNSVSA